MAAAHCSEGSKHEQQLAPCSRAATRLPALALEQKPPFALPALATHTVEACRGRTATLL